MLSIPFQLSAPNRQLIVCFLEVVERRYPVTVERFHLRDNSGGAGQHRGGDGVVRELR
jgi:N-methylhydantoinase B/oxoprolinase/acetone carboxylase alpha subunit